MGTVSQAGVEDSAEADAGADAKSETGSKLRGASPAVGAVEESADLAKVSVSGDVVVHDSLGL